MKTKWFFLILMAFLFIDVMASLTHSKGEGLPSELSAYDGKLFTGVEDPEFINYDLALRNYLTKRINKR